MDSRWRMTFPWSQRVERPPEEAVVQLSPHPHISGYQEWTNEASVFPQVEEDGSLFSQGRLQRPGAWLLDKENLEVSIFVSFPYPLDFLLFNTQPPMGEKKGFIIFHDD